MKLNWKIQMMKIKNLKYIIYELKFIDKYRYFYIIKIKCILNFISHFN